MLSLALCAHNSDVVGASLEWNLSSPVINYTCGPGTFFAAHKYLHTFRGKSFGRGWGRLLTSLNTFQSIVTDLAGWNHRSDSLKCCVTEPLNYPVTQLPSHWATQPLSRRTTERPRTRKCSLPIISTAIFIN